MCRRAEEHKCNTMKRLLMSLVLFSAVWVPPASALDVLDTDGDGYDDATEIAHGYSPRHTDGKRLREVDSDDDGAWDDWEMALGTDLLNPDTDGDGFLDGVEIQHGYDPNTSEPRRVPKRIEVSLADQRATYLLGEVVLDTFWISSGKPSTPTPTGSFTVL